MRFAQVFPLGGRCFEIFFLFRRHRLGSPVPGCPGPVRIGKGPSGLPDLGPVEKVYSFKLQKLGGGLVRRYVLLAKGSGIEASRSQQRKRMFWFWGAGGLQEGFRRFARSSREVQEVRGVLRDS